jgi:hypothetical protein
MPIRRLRYFLGQSGWMSVDCDRKMDIYKAIRELHVERVRLDRVIAALEELQKRGDSSTRPTVGRRRGRKSMKAEEREQVAVRMKGCVAKTGRTSLIGC